MRETRGKSERPEAPGLRPGPQVPVVRARVPRVRAAVPGDRDRIADLLRRADLPYDDLDDALLSNFSVAEISGAVAGCAGVELHAPYGLLRSVAVEPDRRGCGVGQALAAERVAWAREQKLAALFLLTTTAAPFFARLGFEHVARASVPSEIQVSREFADLCPESATVMRLVL